MKLAERTGAMGRWDVKIRDPQGRLIRRDRFKNLVVNAGLDHLLDVALAGGTQITSWYIGLTDGSPTPAAADTLASHSGWTEVTAYSESARQAFTPGTVSGQSVDNSASVATFTVNADGTVIGGAFLASAASGTSGTLYAAGAFTGGNVTLSNGSTIQITATFTQAAA